MMKSMIRNAIAHRSASKRTLSALVLSAVTWIPLTGECQLGIEIIPTMPDGISLVDNNPHLPDLAPITAQSAAQAAAPNAERVYPALIDLESYSESVERS